MRDFSTIARFIIMNNHAESNLDFKAFKIKLFIFGLHRIGFNS